MCLEIFSLGDITTPHSAHRCVISCLIEKRNILFSFRNSISSLLRLLMDIELAPFYWDVSLSEKLWVFNKKKPISKIGVLFHQTNWKVKEFVIIIYPTFWHLSFFSYSKILKNNKNYSVCTLLNPFYFVCCLFIWTVKIVCWIGT